MYHAQGLDLGSLLIHNVHHADMNFKATIARIPGISVSYCMSITAIIPVISVSYCMSIIAMSVYHSNKAIYICMLYGYDTNTV